MIMVDIDKAFRLRPIEDDYGFSQAVRAGDFLFISGSVSWDNDGTPTNVGDMGAQMRSIYVDIGKTLKHHGLDPTDIVKETIYVTDMDKFFEGAQARADFYQGVVPPAATGVEINRLVNTDFMIEIEAIAYFNR
ncbi:hypothetical protein HY78_22515 [Rhizorhabdus wittichii DC-6]|jgi:2-iminobutanoate/2-iminopropanoate deaminase|nr:hypothetical protein HY78_22515 [Rhizorhabdus wittichii DC-6]